MAAKKARPLTKSGKPRARKGVKLKPTDLSAPELVLGATPPELEELSSAVRADGGAVLACYREPLGGNPQLFVALPVDKVQPTPYQRDVSDSHVRRLTLAMDKTRRYLDPIIVVRHEDGQYYTPNGGHRLTAVKELGAKTILALLVPEARVAYQILALNIEKAHNLRERALEVARMYRELVKLPVAEEEMALELEEPALITLGFAYEARGRLSGAVYHPVVKKLDAWLPGKLAGNMAEREKRAQAVLELDDAVGEAVKRLKEKGLESPYLKNFVVARINPLRFIKGPPPEYYELLAQMTKRARGMDAAKIDRAALSSAGGPAEEG